MLNKLVFLYLNVYFNWIILCAIVICDPGGVLQKYPNLTYHILS